MLISNVLNATIASPSNAVLTIKDTVFAPGQLSFGTTNYFVNEGDGSATITVIRTGGSSGTVSAFYYTTPITAMLSLWDWSLSAGDRSDGMLPYYKS